MKVCYSVAARSALRVANQSSLLDDIDAQRMSLCMALWIAVT